MKIWAFLFAIMFTTFSYGSSLHCRGVIQELAIGHTGHVSIFSEELWGNRNLARTICSLETEWKGVSVETCRGWLSQMLYAKASAAVVRVQYTGGPTECGLIPAWDDANNPHSLRVE